MKDEESGSTSSSSSIGLGKTSTKYKLWVFSALVLLAFWSLFIGSLTLKSTTTISDDLQSSLHDEIDILELGEREKVVRRMWEVYTERSIKGSIRLSKFWVRAFEAGFEYLVSDVPGVRDTAVSEIAKLSIHNPQDPNQLLL